MFRIVEYEIKRFVGFVMHNIDEINNIRVFKLSQQFDFADGSWGDAVAAFKAFEFFHGNKRFAARWSASSC